MSTARAENGCVYVTVAGEVDLYTAPQLEQALAEPASSFVVDLSDCSFIDSTALGILVAARSRVGRVELVAPGLEVRRTLEISGLDQVFPVQASRPQDGTVAVDA